MGYFKLHHGAEGFEALDLFLDFGDSGAQLIELFEAEETVADGTLEKDIERHSVEVLLNYIN